jgi:hypothetical protein
MYLINAILGLRKLGIGRSLSASEIVGGIDKYLFTATDWAFEGYLLFDEHGDSKLLPLLPANHPSQLDEYVYVYFDEIEDLYPELQIWCKGFGISDADDERDLNQFDAINCFLLVSEVIKYLLTPEERDEEEFVQKARSAVSNISSEFWVASGFFNRALDNPDDTGTLLLEDWVNKDTYKFCDEDCDELAKKFCEVAIWLSSFLASNDFLIPLDLPPWKEDTDFLSELELLGRPTWSSVAFNVSDVSDLRFSTYFHDVITNWLRIFNHYYLPSKWAYYFWESPLDASVWADSGFKPIEAALWDSIGYDTFDALVANENEWVYTTIAPMVRAGMTIMDENVELWGNAASSAEIIDAIDRGFPDVSEYKKYSTVEADYTTIQKFLEKTKAQLSSQEISRAIRLEQNGMDIREAIAWSKIDLNFSLVREFQLAQQTPLQAKKWIDSGIPLDLALKGMTLGLPLRDVIAWSKIDRDLSLVREFQLAQQTPLQAKKWIDSGIPLDLALKWMSVGIYLEEALAWSKIDRDLSAVLRFKSFGLTPLHAAQWNERGFQLDVAIKWVSLGLDIRDALLWLEQEIDHEVASWFLERKIDNPREAKLWLKYIPKKEIQNWHDAGFEPFLASDWREIGFGPEASLEWLNQGVETAIEASKWNQGFIYHRDALKEAAEWISRSISHENAQKWKAKGITPEIAERREQAGIKP